MNYFKSHKALIWILIVLLIINASAMGTMLYFRFFERSEFSAGFIPERPPRFLQDRLKLNEEQRDCFAKMHMGFREAVAGIREDMAINRREVLEEITKSEPDTIKLMKLAAEYGELHSSLKMQTVRHFLEMKGKIRPEQKEFFRKFIQSMSAYDDMPSHDRRRGPDRGRKYRHGQDKRNN